jgi:ribosome-binding protein aMBF1 (putative translation factor)
MFWEIVVVFRDRDIGGMASDSWGTSVLLTNWRRRKKNRSRQNSRLNSPAWWRGWRHCTVLKQRERLVGTERKRGWVAPRSLLVYVAREWCGIKARVLAEHLNCDASMVSRLHAVYAAARDKRSESELQRLLRIKSPHA